MFLLPRLALSIVRDGRRASGFRRAALRPLPLAAPGRDCRRDLRATGRGGEEPCMISRTPSTVPLTRFPMALPAATAIRSAASITPSTAPEAIRPTSPPISPAARTDPRTAVTATEPTSVPTSRAPETAAAAVFVSRPTTLPGASPLRVVCRGGAPDLLGLVDLAIRGVFAMSALLPRGCGAEQTVTVSDLLASVKTPRRISFLTPASRL